MPTVRKGESRKHYVGRAVPILMKEGLSRRQAVGKAEGMYDYYQKKNRKSRRKRKTRTRKRR